MKKNNNIDIVFDGNDALIVLKSDLDLKIECIEKLNKEIGFVKGFCFGISIASIFMIIIIMMVIFL